VNRVRNLGAVAVIAAIATLTGCAISKPAPAPASSVAADPSTPSPIPTPDPVFVPGGSAEDNRPVFDFVGDKIAESNHNARGRDFVDALVAAGFDKAAMALTADETPTELTASSISWAVKINDQCLVGQFFPDQSNPVNQTRPEPEVRYASAIIRPISTGACLVGGTRPIDW
jgi:hypothetical protein